MKASIIAVFAIMSAGALADLHYNAICINKNGKKNVYAESNTRTACTYYRNRHTGSNWWDTCPDCKMVESDVPYCNSAAKHIGGDEMSYYCKLTGAAGSLAN